MPASDIILDAKINVLSNQALKDVSDFGRRAERLLALPLGKMSKNASEFDKSLAASNARVIAFGASAGIIFGVQRAFSALLKSTIEVEARLTDINVLMNQNATSLERFGQGLFQVARDTGKTFGVVAQAAGELARQGLSAEDTLSRTKDALILARLGAMDATAAVDALTAAINSFNKSGLTSQQIVNKLANVDAAFAVSSGDLAEAIKRVGSTAQDTGVSFEKMVGLITAAKQITQRDGSVIGNSFKTILQRVRNPEVLEFLDHFGVKILDNNGAVKDSYTLLHHLASNYESLNPLLQDFVVQLGAGVYQSNQMRAVLNDLADSNGIAAQAIRKAGEESDVANERMARLNTTLADTINKTRESLREAGAKIGQGSFANPLKAGLDSINAALMEFNKLSTNTTGGAILQDVLQGLGEFLSGPALAMAGAVIAKLLYDATVFTKDAMSSFMGINKSLEQQTRLQQLSLAIISKEPALLDAVLNKKISLASLEKQILADVKQRVALEGVLNTTATAAAQSMFAKGVSVTSKGNIRGITPNHSPVAEAIKRERAAGVPAALIRVGSHPSLVNNLNPRGLGVYNLRDEPLGLQQGVHRAAAMGYNPQTHGVPNYASEKPYLPLQSAAMEKMFVEQKQKIFEEIQTRKLNLKNLDELNAVAKNLAKSFNADASALRRLIQSFTYAFNTRPGNLPTAAQAASKRRPEGNYEFSGMPFFYLSQRKLLGDAPQRKLLTEGSKHFLLPDQNPLTSPDRLNNLFLSGRMGNEIQARHRQNTYFTGRDLNLAYAKLDAEKAAIANAANLSPVMFTHAPQGGSRMGIGAPTQSTMTQLPASHPVMQLQTPRGQSAYPLGAVNAQNFQAQARANLWAELQSSQQKGRQFNEWNNRLNAAGAQGFLSTAPFILPNGFQAKPTTGQLNEQIKQKRNWSKFARRAAFPTALAAPMIASAWSDTIDTRTNAGKYKAAAMAGVGDIGMWAASGSMYGWKGGIAGTAIGTAFAGKRMLDTYNNIEGEEDELAVLKNVRFNDGKITRKGLDDLRSSFKMAGDDEIDHLANFRSGLIKAYMGGRKREIETDHNFKQSQMKGATKIDLSRITHSGNIDQLNANFDDRLVDLDTDNILNLARSQNRPYELQEKQTAIELEKTELQKSHRLQLINKHKKHELDILTQESNLSRDEARFGLEQSLSSLGSKELESLIKSPVQSQATSKDFIKSLTAFQDGVESIKELTSLGNYEEALKQFDFHADSFLKNPGTNSVELIKDLEAQIREQRLNIEKTIINDKLIAEQTSQKTKVIESEYAKQAETIKEETAIRKESLKHLDFALKSEMNYKFGGRQREDLLNRNIFSSDYAGEMIGIRNRRIIGELPGGYNPVKDTGASFVDSLRYDTQDLYRDLNEGAYEVGENLKSSFKGAFKEFASGASSAKDALRGFGLGVLNNVFDRVLDSSFDMFAGSVVNGVSAFGGSFFAPKGTVTVGPIQGYSTGGPVVGGSGTKDDVPAMLSAGEYVVRKRTI